MGQPGPTPDAGVEPFCCLPASLHLCLIPSLSAKEVNYDDLVIRDGIYYEKFKNVPFKGTMYRLIITNTTYARVPVGDIKNGLKEGEWQEYHDNGQLWTKGSYKRGVKEGVWLNYYDNGQLFEKGYYEKGQEQGVWEKYWSEDGKLRKKISYNNGELVSEEEF